MKQNLRVIHLLESHLIQVELGRDGSNSSRGSGEHCDYPPSMGGVPLTHFFGGFRLPEQLLRKLWANLKVPLPRAESDSHISTESQESLRADDSVQ